MSKRSNRLALLDSDLRTQCYKYFNNYSNHINVAYDMLLPMEDSALEFSGKHGESGARTL